jgi:iron-sulfur cluster repair protein YtfE (RIC family)
MGKHVRHLNRGEFLAPTAVALLGKPLDYIHEDHLRERQICTLIDEIAHGDIPDTDTIAAILSFLSHELPLHLRDEEEDLFPLLRRRCEREDEIEKVIKNLHADHVHAGEDTPRVVALLEDLANKARGPKGPEQDMLLTFASHARRHLILENAIILPFARLRLTETDLETLYIRMCQRRGLEGLKELGNAQRST